MKTYDDYLKEVTVMLKAGHNRSDILKVLKTTYLFNQDDDVTDSELSRLINDIENTKKLEHLFM